MGEFAGLLPEWRPVNHRAEGFPYEVSNTGEVRHAETGDVLTPWLDGGGREYQRVELYRPTDGPGRGEARKFYVHQLVAWAWLEDPPDGWHVHHIDGDTTNNTPENLQYAEPSKNSTRARGRL